MAEPFTIEQLAEIADNTELWIVIFAGTGLIEIKRAVKVPKELSDREGLGPSVNYRTGHLKMAMLYLEDNGLGAPLGAFFGNGYFVIDQSFRASVNSKSDNYHVFLNFVDATEWLSRNTDFLRKCFTEK